MSLSLFTLSLLLITTSTLKVEVLLLLLPHPAHLQHKLFLNLHFFPLHLHRRFNPQIRQTKAVILFLTWLTCSQGRTFAELPLRTPSVSQNILQSAIDGPLGRFLRVGLTFQRSQLKILEHGFLISDFFRRLGRGRGRQMRELIFAFLAFLLFGEILLRNDQKSTLKQLISFLVTEFLTLHHNLRKIIIDRGNKKFIKNTLFNSHPHPPQISRTHTHPSQKQTLFGFGATLVKAEQYYKRPSLSNKQQHFNKWQHLYRSEGLENASAIHKDCCFPKSTILKLINQNHYRNILAQFFKHIYPFQLKYSATPKSLSLLLQSTYKQLILQATVHITLTYRLSPFQIYNSIMNPISTLFEALWQNFAIYDWNYLSRQLLDQPLTTLILVSVFVLIHIAGRIKNTLATHKNISIHQSHISNQTQTQPSEQDASTVLPIAAFTDSSQHQQFQNSSLQLESRTQQQPKQQNSRIITNKDFIELLKQYKHQAKIKQAQLQNKLIFAQKLKKKAHQRNQIVDQHIVSRLRKSKKNTADKHSQKKNEINDNNIQKTTEQNKNEKQILTTNIFIKSPILFSQFQQQQCHTGIFDNLCTSCFQKQDTSAAKHAAVKIEQKQQLQKQQPKIDTSHQQKHINNQAEFLETIITFASTVKSTAQITTTMSNLGGARSSLPNLLIFAKSFISTIDLSNDSQVTAFAIKIYNSIVFTLIRNSNLKDGVERIPPKSKSSQVEKNSINSYILILNIYRLMGVQKVWLIVFGKLLKLLEFVYQRTEQLKSHEELQLIVQGYIQKKGEISSRYLSRLDYLSYLLLGLTSFDPLLIWDLNSKTDPEIIRSRQEMMDWNKSWSYKEFWVLVSCILKNSNQFYFKPILYMNIMSVLYPKIYMNKLDSQSFKQEYCLYETILNRSKDFFVNYKSNDEMQALSKSFIGSYEYDAEDFNEGIKVLQNRILIQKNNEIKLNADQFRTKANIFYYFSKEN